MRKLLKRWYVWLGLVLLLGLAGSVALICSGRGRITQANFDRIQIGISYDETTAILGEDEFPVRQGGVAGGISFEFRRWRDRRDGPSWILVCLTDHKVSKKEIHLATGWETLRWYAKKGAEKIGVKWN
jgi:hypothetical protein